MKAYQAGLQNTVVTSYDKTKTTALGRAYQKTINSQQVLGPALTQFVDVFTQTGLSPIMSHHVSSSNHLYILAGASPSPTVLLYNFNTSTGVYSYVGKVICNLPNTSATTHTFRGFKAYESGSQINLVIATTGSVVINGGVNMAWNLSASDFTIAGTQIYPASGSNQKAMYFLQDSTSAAFGCFNALTTAGGVAIPAASTNGAINTKAFAQNGAAATMSIYSWDLATAPTVAGLVTNGISSNAAGFAGTAPTAYFSMGASQNGYNVITSTAALFEAVVLMNGTGNVPTGFTAWTPGTAQTTGTNAYFMRDLQQVGGVWYFNLATTGVAAATLPTQTNSNFSLARAGGISNNSFNFKTGTLPALSGTILQSNSFDYAKPTSVPANTALNGQDCLSFGTGTTVYLGKISDLSSLGTTWSSETAVTLSGGSSVTAPTATFVAYSTVLDKWIITTNTSSFLMIPHQAGAITTWFGGLTTSYLEGLSPVTVQLGAAALSSVDMSNGWIFLSSTTTGQRGVIFADLASDAMFGNAAVISPVLNVPAGSVFKFIDAFEQLFDYTDSMYFWVRNGTTSTDAAFSAANIPTPTNNNGWTLIATAKDLSTTAIGPYFQLAVTFQVATLSANTPAQIYDLLYTVTRSDEMSDNWEGSVDNTTQNGASPAYTAFRLQSAYATSVPTLYFRAYDDNGNLVASANTASNPTFFDYSTNNGTSWTALGSIPNTALTTEVRYKWATPPGVRVTCSLRES